MAGRDQGSGEGFLTSILPGFSQLGSLQASHASNHTTQLPSPNPNASTTVTVGSGHTQHQSRGTGDGQNSRGQPPNVRNSSRVLPGNRQSTRKPSTPRNSTSQLSTGRSSTLNTSNRSTPGRLSNRQNSTGDSNQNSTGQAHNQNSTRQALNGRNQPFNGQDSTGHPPQSFSRQQLSGPQSQHSSGHLRRQHNIPSPYPQPSEVMQLVSRIKGIEERIKRVEEQTYSIKECLDSVKDLLEKHLQQSFKIKGGMYEATLKAECAKLFCTDMRREVPLPKVQGVVSKVLKSEAKDKHKFSVALSYCRERLNQFRSDEKRKVLGVGPYEKQQSHKNPTDILADNIIKAPAGVRSQYIKNLSLLRKFIREARPNSDKLHEQFRTWLDENPTSTGDLDQVVAEDQLVNYENGDPMFAQVEEAANNYSYTNTGNQDQQLDDLLQYEHEGWNRADHEDDFSPPDEFSGNVIGREVVHGENVL